MAPTHAHAAHSTVAEPGALIGNRPFSPRSGMTPEQTRGGHSFSRVPVHSPGRGQSAQPASGGAIQRTEDQKPGFFQKIGNAFNAFTGPQIGPLHQPNRVDLDDHLRQFESPSFFTSGLNRVNRGYDLNTSEKLPDTKLQEYKELSSLRESGQIRDSQAFARSAWGWAKQGHLPGFMANAGGAVVTGLHEGIQDDINRKLGRY